MNIKAYVPFDICKLNVSRIGNFVLFHILWNHIIQNKSCQNKKNVRSKKNSTILYIWHISTIIVNIVQICSGSFQAMNAFITHSGFPSLAHNIFWTFREWVDFNCYQFSYTGTTFPRTLFLLCWVTRDFVGGGGVMRNRKQKETAGHSFLHRRLLVQGLALPLFTLTVAYLLAHFLGAGQHPGLQVFQIWPVLFLQSHWLLVRGIFNKGSNGINLSYRSPPLSVFGVWRWWDTDSSVHCSGFQLTLSGSNFSLLPLHTHFFLPDHLILWFWVVSKWLCFCAQTWLNQADKFGPYLIF